jgi:uncharacterized protein YciI
MFVLLSRYLKPLEEIDKVVGEHRAFLEKHYASGDLLISGPQNPRTGGVIVTKEMTREAVEAMLAQDPFVREGCSEYQLIEFNPTRPVNA